MGGTSSSKDRHLLHFHKSHENKLWVFLPSTETFSCFPVFRDNGPFFFGNLETISVPPLSTVFVVGGSGFRENPDHQRLEDYEDRLVEQRDLDPEEHEEMNEELKKTLFARAEKATEQLVPMNIVGYINLGGLSDNKLYFEYEDCEQLDKARIGHSMVFNDPYIYMIGGIVDNLPNHSCKKFHVYDKVWCDIASVGFYGTLSSPAICAVDEYIYVFDSYSDTQSIHKYSIAYDIWENIAFKTTDFTIPKSLNATVFRYTDNHLLLMNGISEEREQSIYYYVYDIEKEQFVQERSDRKLIHPFKDRQGNRDYRYGGKLFCQLSENKIKVFHKNTYYWDNLSIYLVKIQKQKLTIKNVSGGCCGGR